MIDLNSDYTIRSLQDCSFDELYEAHSRAFKDYLFQWSKRALEKTIQRRSYDPSISFGAFHNGKLVSFTWNGIGKYNGVLTAYDTGTGTVEEHRGKGLASKIFEHSIPFLKERGIVSYILEVYEENTKAFSVYSKQGFQVTRTFDCFRVNFAEWKLPAHTVPKGIAIKKIDLSYQDQMEPMMDFGLSWQNNFTSMHNAADGLRILGAFMDRSFIGYGIIEPESGDIPQLAVAREHRNKGIGSLLLNELKKLNQADIIKVVNIPSDQEAILSFIRKNNIPRIVRQFEMERSI